MLRFGIPSFRLEKDIIDAEIDVLRKLGVEFKTCVEIGKDTTIEVLRNNGYKSFYVAIGAQGGRRLGVDGEDAEGVVSGVDFLRECAVRNGGRLHGKVVVIGGGNVAVDVVRTAVRSGAETVQLFCLESRDIMPAAGDELAEAEAEGIVVNNAWAPKEILTKDGRVCGVVFKKCISVFDEEKRFNPQYDENDTLTVEADYVLTAIGQSIQWGSVLEGSNVELNRDMTARADGFTYQTAQSDIFVGGDVYTGPKFAIDAIAAGKQGAESIHRFVWGHDLELGRDRRDYKYIDKDNLNVREYDTAKRQKPASDKSKKLTYSDDRMTLTEEQVKIEAARCLGCGASHIDQNLCLGCAMCTVRCKFDAIHLIKKYDVTPVGFDNLLPTAVEQEFLRRKALVEEREQRIKG
jgi:thioredoxin reductase/ferredoxin